MKKKILLSIIIICLGVITFGAMGASAKTYGDLTYTISDGVVTITYCNTSANEVIIPEEIAGYPVKIIGRYAFSDCTSLTDITIPGSVTTIGDRSFEYCTSLTNIKVADNNRYYSSLNGNLFNKNKTELVQYAIGKTDVSYTIPDSVTTIGDRSFEYCRNLTDITIPDSVTTIGEAAFIECRSLTDINIPDSVTTIGFAAFAYCTSLTNVTIPNSVTTIGFGAFAYCTSLTKIKVKDNNSCYSSVNGNVFNKNKTELIQYAIGKTDVSYIIPNSVIKIVDYAFAGCKSLTNITIPDSVTSIGGYAFPHCTSLTNATIPDSVNTIGNYAFYACKSLTDVYYGGSKIDWKKIYIGYSNECLTNATIHYNYTPATQYIPNQSININTNSAPEYMPDNINKVTINGKGTAYGRFKILNNDGTLAKNKKLYYCVDNGMEQSVTTDNYGYATVSITGISRSKDYNVSFSGNQILPSTGIVSVTVEPLHFKNSFEAGIEKGVTAGYGFEASGEFGVLEAKAGVASIGLEGSDKNSFSFEQEYANNKNKLTLSSKTNYSAAANAKLGLFAELELPNIPGIDGELINVNGKAKYGGFAGVSYEDDDFKFNDSQDVLNLSKFMLSAFIGTQQGNVVTKYVANILDTPINAYEKGSVINLESGVSTGTIEMKKGNVKGGVTLSGINAKSVWTNTTKTMKDKSHVYSTEIAAGEGTKIFDTSIEYSKAKSSLGGMSDLVNDNLKFSATEDKDGNLKELSLSSKQSGEDGSFLYKKTETTSKKITYKDDAAKKIANSDNELKKFVIGDKAYFSKAQMKQAIDKVINSDQSGKYSQTKNTKEALSLDLSASFQLLLKLGGKYGLSGSTCYEYESENGIYENGTAYVQAENDIKDEVASLALSFDAIKECTKNTINDILSGILETFKGLADQAVAYGQAVVENAKNTVTGWVVSITRTINPVNSVAILAVEDEASLFSTASLATTIGEPYIIEVEDEDGNKITDFSDNPLTLTLTYTKEQLYEAGVAEDDVISAVRWDDEKGVYVKQEGIYDRQNSCVTLEILKPGQYILAFDNCAPAVTQFGVNGNGMSPEIYAIVSDMSGIQTFMFSIDDEEILNNSDFDKYYNHTTGEFLYLTKDMESGEHTATIYAADSFGNEIRESIQFMVDMSVPTIENMTAIPTVITEDIMVSASVANANTSSVMLNAEITDIYGNVILATVDMVEHDGIYSAPMPQIQNGLSANVWVSAYSELGNGAESEKQRTTIMKTEGDNPIIAITKIEGNSISVMCRNFDDSAEGVICLGVYDENENLLQFKSMNIAEKVTFTDVLQSGNFKVFVWDDNLKPLSKALIQLNDK